MNVSFVHYDPATGLIESITVEDEAFFQARQQAGEVVLAIGGPIDIGAVMVDVATKAIVAKPAAAPSAAQLSDYATQKQIALLAAGITVNVAASGDPAVNILCDGTNGTRADLALLGLFGQLTPAATKTWLDNNGVATVLTGAEFINLTTLIGTWVANTYAALATLLGEINSGAITTTAQIDAFAWPAS